MSNERYRLTTKDNPYNPFTQWSEWYFYDAVVKGYCTSERIAKIAKTSDQLPDEINNEQVEAAINEIKDLGAFSKQGEFVEFELVKNPELKDSEEKQS